MNKQKAAAAVGDKVSKPINIIREIRDKQLCTGCGTCAGICAAHAIRMAVLEGLYIPTIEGEKCVGCGLCVASCPGDSVDFVDQNRRLFDHQPSDASFGNFLKCYVGYSNDLNIRYTSASGGLTSQILITALKLRLIDGALVVRMKHDQPLVTEAFVAKTEEEVLSASKSKYCPAPTNEALRQILTENKRFAVVGLPCHLHGIRKAEIANKKLKERIVLHIGIMCSHSVNFAGTDLVLEKLGIRSDDVKAISYRGFGWPGGIRVTLRDGSQSSIPLFGTWHSYWSIFSSYFFTPLRCLMCPDHTAELADISLGDAWFPELKRDKIGQSVVVTRTEIAETFISALCQEKAASLIEVDSDKVKQSQKLLIKFKKDFFESRLSLLKILGKQTPHFNMTETHSGSLWSPINFLRAFYPFFNSSVSSNKSFRALLKFVPFPLFRLYFGVYKLLSII